VTAPFPEDAAVVPIGRPIDNVRLYVVDRHLGLSPLGVPGELCIGGASVGQGYVNDPERTAAAFVPDRFGVDAVGASLYRTGDRVRMRCDGTLEFLGRIDHQVKIRGFRIELGEIESVLARCPGVREAAVIARGSGKDVPQIVAFVSFAPDVAEPPDCRRYLQDRLPDHMVPAAIVPLPALPRLATGKVDRRHLYRVETAAGAVTEFIPPHAGVETELALIWAELLGVNRIGRHDGFFQLGGHSILGARLMARLRQRLGVDLPVRVLFESPTLSALARQIEIANWVASGAPTDDTGDREQFTL
jgi:hypothetical protein